jgi:hypothetical protein
MKIVELHGFNVKDKGKGSIGLLREPLLKEFPDAIMMRMVQIMGVRF